MLVKIKTAHGYLSFQPDGRIEYRQNAGGWETIDLEGLELQAVTPGNPTTPNPGNGDDPLYGCRAGSDVGNQGDLVRCLHDRIKPAGDVGKVFDVVKRVAWALRDKGAGLLIKRGGANIVDWNGESYSASRVVFRDGRMFKTMTDVPNGSPAWNEEDSPDMSMYVPAINPNS